jgi:hypothetical protein
MSISLDDLTADRSFTTGGKTGGQATFLPEPEGRRRRKIFLNEGWWLDRPPGDPVRQRAKCDGDDAAYVAEHGALSWAVVTPNNMAAIPVGMQPRP